MNILLVHNRYRCEGGEERMVEATARIFAQRGHTVQLAAEKTPAPRGIPSRAALFAGGIHSRSAKRAMAERLSRSAPDVAHVHNLYPVFTPSVLEAFAEAGVPVVMTCHNYRLVCPTSLMVRNNRVCDRCAKGSAAWCWIYNCRGNRLESAAYSLRSMAARQTGVFERNVTRFVATSGYVKSVIQPALPPGTPVDTVYNVVDPPDRPGGIPAEGGYVGFIGRISPEKGVETLLDAAARLPGIPFAVAGDGPERARLEALSPPNVRWTGRLGGGDVDAFYRGAAAIAVPSVWNEPFGLTCAEAMVRGIPVTASRTGALPELVRHGRDGYLFPPGSAGELARFLRQLWNDRPLARRMGASAARAAASRFGPEEYYSRMMEVYLKAAGARGGASRGMTNATREAV